PGEVLPPRNALHFDLGGSMPLRAVDLSLPPSIHVAPVRLQARQRSDEPWVELGSRVFYRLERDGVTIHAPPWALRATARYLRVVPDDRTSALDPASTRLLVKVRLASLVFANQGTPPYRLTAGATDASDGALPIDTLMPQFDPARQGLGRARL